MDSASRATIACFLILSIFTATTMITTTAEEDKDLVEVVKGPDCSPNKTKDSLFQILTMPELLTKLTIETPKHPNKDAQAGGGFSYNATAKDFGPKGEGNASCVKDKSKKDCDVCLGAASFRLTADCNGKATGSVELKACQMSFKEVSD